MSTGTLFLIFSGLIAFVPGEGGQAGYMTAFLVRSAEHPHVPILAVPSTRVLRCPVTCDSGKDFCRCRLAGAVVLDPLPTPATRLLRERPRGVLPDEVSIDDNGWLVHMENADNYFARLDPDRIGTATAANVRFGWDEAATCALDEDEDDGRIFAVQFIRRGNVTHEQAVAELVTFQATIPSEVLTIWLSGGDYLSVKCGGDGCPVILSNESAIAAQCDSCSGCAAGSHFGEYVRLTGGGFGSLRLFRQCGRSSNPGENESEICKYARGYVGFPAVSNRIICPMVVLEP